MDAALCKLWIRKAEASVSIWAESDILHVESTSANGKAVPETRMEENFAPPAHHQISEAAPRRFRHYFAPNKRPFPYVYHPSTEGPRHGRHRPYIVMFHNSQQFVEGELGALKPTPGLRYLFEREEDRDRVRAFIFGKNLLVSCGVEEVSFPSYLACQQGTVSLWYNETTENRTLSFYRTSDNPPRGDVEYIVSGIDAPIQGGSTQRSTDLKILRRVRRTAQTTVSTSKKGLDFLKLRSRNPTHPSTDPDHERLTVIFEEAKTLQKLLRAYHGLPPPTPPPKG